jgi:hypothetical protein
MHISENVGVSVRYPYAQSVSCGTPGAYPAYAADTTSYGCRVHASNSACSEIAGQVVAAGAGSISAGSGQLGECTELGAIISGAHVG